MAKLKSKRTDTFIWQHTRLNRSQDRSDTSELWVEIARIGGIGDLRLKGRGDPFMIDVIPIDISEESMTHDLLCVGRAGTQSMFGFASQELLKDRYRVPRHMDGI